MYFEDNVFAIVDDEGNTIAYARLGDVNNDGIPDVYVIQEDGNRFCAQLEDVTNDGIPDVIHITQEDGNKFYVPLNEVVTENILEESIDDPVEIFSDLNDNLLDELSHHLEPGQKDPHTSQLFENESVLNESVRDGFDILCGTDRMETESIFNNELADDNLFENEVSDISSKISFTGLVDKGLVNSDTYTSWLDGVEPDEVTPEDISVIADHIADEFNQICPAVVTDNNRDGFATITDANGIILYDIDGTVEAAHKYGVDNIVGSIAHEMGHNITEKAFEGSGIELTRIQKELCSDYLEGMVFGLAGLSPEGKYEFLKDHNVASSDYPTTEERIAIIQKGYDFASDPVHQGLATALFPNLSFVQNKLMENIINVYE